VHYTCTAPPFATCISSLPLGAPPSLTPPISSSRLRVARKGGAGCDKTHGCTETALGGAIVLTPGPTSTPALASHAPTATPTFEVVDLDLHTPAPTGTVGPTASPTYDPKLLRAVPYTCGVRTVRCTRHRELEDQQHFNSHSSHSSTSTGGTGSRSESVVDFLVRRCAKCTRDPNPFPDLLLDPLLFALFATLFAITDRFLPPPPGSS
jgi:hypothetical protein